MPYAYRKSIGSIPHVLREKSANGVPLAVGTSMNQLSWSPLSFVRSLDLSVFSLLLKMTFAMTKAMARAASRRQKAPLLIRPQLQPSLSAVSLTFSMITSADLDLL